MELKLSDEIESLRSLRTRYGVIRMMPYGKPPSKNVQHKKRYGAVTVTTLLPIGRIIEIRPAKARKWIYYPLWS